MINTTLNTETALTINNETQPWGAPEEFDMPKATVKVYNSARIKQIFHLYIIYYKIGNRVVPG